MKKNSSDLNDSNWHYCYLNGQHIARRNDTTTEWYGTDHLGSTVLITDSEGNDLWNGERTPFGDFGEDSDLNSDDTVKSTGKEWDDDASLYYYNAWWYDANSGRFTSEDPIRDGLNYYVYVNNNPVNRIDPTGLRQVVANDTEGEVITEDDYESESVEITVEREDDLLGNEFDSERTIESITMENGQVLDVGYTDQVGVNAASKEFAEKYNGMTLPDGDSHLLSAPLTPNNERSFDSSSYHNTFQMQQMIPIFLKKQEIGLIV